MADVRVHRLTEDRDDLLEAYAAVRVVTDAEVNPEDPPPTIEEVTAEVFCHWTRQRRIAWVATVDGRGAGELTLAVEDGEDNRHRADVEWLAVVPEHRRAGVADALVREAIAWAIGDGRSSMTFWVPTLADGAGVAYAERCGATVRMEERCSRVRVADVPEELIERWLADGRARTDGYRLVHWVGPVPDAHVPLMVAAHRAMEDMPTDDLDWTIPAMDEADIRSFDAAVQAWGQCPVVTVAVAPDGSAAGFSAMFLNGHRPQLASQGDTGVLEAHRGRGLGRWVKAENLRRALATEPRVEVIETYNAESNPWMLDINVAMGFRPHMGYQAWQADVTTVRGALG